MKTLTLTQPWATLVAIGAKKIETRSWSTQYRGSLAIHAAKGFPKWAKEICSTNPFGTVLAEKADILHHEGLPLSVIVATCNLVEVIKVDEIISFPACTEHWKNGHKFDLNPTERAFGDYSVGRYIWLLEDIKLLDEPIPAKGALSLWEWNNAGAIADRVKGIEVYDK